METFTSFFIGFLIVFSSNIPSRQITKSVLEKAINLIETPAKIVIPRNLAEQSAKYNHDILIKDIAGRKYLHKNLGIPLDKTVN